MTRASPDRMLGAHSGRRSRDRAARWYLVKGTVVSAFVRTALAGTMTAVALLAPALGVASAAPPSRASAPIASGRPPITATQPGANGLAKADRDRDKISDDLEAVLTGQAPGSMVKVLVRGATGDQGRLAAPSLKVTRGYGLLRGFAGSVTAGQVLALSRMPSVRRVELDGTARATDAAGEEEYGVTAARADYGTAAGALDGGEVGICLVDTGIDPGHEQLAGRVVGWRDWVNGQPDPYDDNGHGTHVASLAAGSGAGSAAAQRYGGVARGADLIAAKVLGASGAGRDSDVAAAIEWCAARDDVDVISLSLGSPAGDGSDLVSTMANAAVAAGKVVVAAAGNGGTRPARSARPASPPTSSPSERPPTRTRCPVASTPTTDCSWPASRGGDPRATRRPGSSPTWWHPGSAWWEPGPTRSPPTSP